MHLRLELAIGEMKAPILRSYLNLATIKDDSSIHTEKFLIRVSPTKFSLKKERKFSDKWQWAPMHLQAQPVGARILPMVWVS